jgi:CRP/FNR family transcriptional regulator
MQSGDCEGGCIKTEQIRVRDSWLASVSQETPLAKLPCDACPGRSRGVCAPLDDARLKRLLQLGGRRRWMRREILYRADEPVQAFYKITRGIVVESRTLVDGRRQIIGIRALGDLCGYPAHEGHYLFTGEALTDVHACAFNGERFDAFVGGDVDVACALAQDVSGKLQRATAHMAAMGQLRSAERVAHFLMEMHELYACRYLPVHPLELQLTRQEIADYIGLTLETVSRAFSKLRDLRVIALVGNDAVAILDKDRLCALAGR